MGGKKCLVRADSRASVRNEARILAFAKDLTAHYSAVCKDQS